jgi:hypothetical protein
VCEPIIAIALAAAGTAVTIDASNKNASFVSAQAKEDAKAQRYQAEQARQIGNIDEERRLRQVRMMIGAQRAAAAANGLDPNTGTPMDLQTQTASLGAEDAMTLRLNAMRQAWGLEVGATNSLNFGAASKVNARNQNTGTLLTGLGSMADSYSTTRTPSMKPKKVDTPRTWTT